ncbi:hypothetical protein KM1_022510 [Entamoeba histolytica HM-3:IMSS]|uniref:WW domain-containing protein n=1 Tax=Entamoeba histolytica HM-3:IMSS TaxID=885315 RepID=M7WWQ4_ENTHI|nr:hypothetical protein KM1_022510 [Entamoeba histolytica HM-3:IMSS]
MKIDIVLCNKGVIGEPVNGYVEVTTKHPIFIKKVKVLFRTKSRYPNYTNSGSIDAREKSNVYIWSEWLKDDIGFQSIETECFSEHYSIKDGRFTEYAPGVNRFPFEIVLPENCCVTVVMGNCHLKWEMIGLVEEEDSTIHKSQPIECPLLYSQRTINDYSPIDLEHDTEKFNIKCSLQTNKVQQGDILNGQVIFRNKTDKPLELFVSCESILEALKKNNSAMDKRIFSHCKHTVGTGVTTLELNIPISPLQLPTVIAPPFSLTNCIIIKVSGTNLNSKEESGMIVPIEVFTLPLNRKNMVEYATSLGYSYLTFKKKNFYGTHKVSPPKINFKEGVEEVREIDSNIPYFIDHINRVVYDDKTTKHICDKIYPEELTLLPQGWSCGYFRNERYFINALTNATTWHDPRDNPLPQHVIEGVTGSLSIIPIQAESVGKDKGIELEILLGKTKIKSSIAKGIDAEFDPIPIRFNLDQQRNNVLVYVYESKELLGVIELDLTEMKFFSNIKRWYYLHPIEHQRTESMGRILLQIAYASPLDRPQITEGFDYISKAHWYFYPPTSQFMEYVNKLNEFRNKFNKEPLVKVYDNKYIVLARESYMYFFQIDESIDAEFSATKKTPTQPTQPTKPYITVDLTIKVVEVSIIPCEVTYEKPRRRFSLSIKKGSRSSSRKREDIIEGDEIRHESIFGRSLSRHDSKSRGSSKDREVDPEAYEELISPQTRSRSRSSSFAQRFNISLSSETKKPTYVINTKKRKGSVSTGSPYSLENHEELEVRRNDENEGILLD